MNEPHVFYVAQMAQAFKVLNVVALAFAGCVSIEVALTLGTVIVVGSDGEVGAIIAAAVIVLVAVTMTVAFMIYMWRILRMRLTVTSSGLEMRGILRDHTIAWADVHHVTVSSNPWAVGAVKVVLKDGTAASSYISSHLNALYRGEAIVWNTNVPTPGYMAAVDAHREYLQRVNGPRPAA